MRGIQEGGVPKCESSVSSTLSSPLSSLVKGMPVLFCLKLPVRTNSASEEGSGGERTPEPGLSTSSPPTVM